MRRPDARGGRRAAGRRGLAGRRVALLVGAEGPGLTDEALAPPTCACGSRWPAGVDSLNVATAAAVAFHAIAAPLG